MAGENSPYISIHQISSAYLYSHPNFFARHRGNRPGKEIPHYYQARYQCFSRLPLLPKYNFSVSALVPALVLMEQPMERTGSGQQRGFANMLAKVFSLLLMHKTTAESLTDSFCLKHHLTAIQETFVEAPHCYPGL